MTDKQLGLMHAERLGVEPQRDMRSGPYTWHADGIPEQQLLTVERLDCWHDTPQDWYAALGRVIRECRAALNDAVWREIVVDV